MASVRNWAVLLVAAQLSFFLLACTSSPSARSSTSPGQAATRGGHVSGGSGRARPTVVSSHGSEVLVTRSDPDLPGGCSPRQVAGLINGFLDAFNRGDQKALSSYFQQKYDPYNSADRGFRWYTMDKQSEYNITDLMRYFRERHKQHERLSLLSVKVSRGGLWGKAQVEFALVRLADDILPMPEGVSYNGYGIGTIDCRSRTIEVWNVGPPLARNSFPCPAPPAWNPGDSVLACASRAR